MGLMDEYTPDSGGGEGIKRLTVLEFKTVYSKEKGTEGKAFVFCKDQNHERKMYKTIYASKMFNRFFTGYILALGLNPMELDQACKEGKGEEWLARYIPGRSGDFDCRYGEANREGKRYLEPFVKAEIDFKEWLESQNGTAPQRAPSAPEPDEPPIDNYEGMASNSDPLPF